MYGGCVLSPHDLLVISMDAVSCHGTLGNLVDHNSFLDFIKIKHLLGCSMPFGNSVKHQHVLP